MPNKAIVLIDSRGVLNATNEYDLARHVEYAEKIKGRDRSIIFIVFTTNSSFDVETIHGPLEIHSVAGNQRFSKNYILQTSKYLRSQGFSQIVYISGDPWESAITTLFISYLSKTKYSAQVQIHADVTSTEWLNLGLVNRVRNSLLRVTLKRFDSIRVTRPDIKKILAIKFKIAKEKFVVSNLRINLDGTIPEEKDSRRKRSISFVGRLSSDRGLDTFSSLVSKVAPKNFEVNIVGSGPKKEEFISNLTDVIGAERVIVWGELKPQEMNKLWNQTGILVSTAPSESFGRTIREAASLGIPVWGVASRGFVEFRDFAGVDWIRILDPKLSDSQAQEIFEDLLICETDSLVRERILSDQEKQQNTLISCWLSLLENVA